jgi:hypothetical protein
MSNQLLIFVPAAIRAVMNRLACRMEAAADASIVQCVDLNPAIPKRIASGEAYDIGMTNPPYVNALIASGHADGSKHLPFGRVPLAIGRKAGMEGPVRLDTVGIADTLRSAESIAYTGAGTSGRIFLEVAERLGVADAISSRSQAMFGGVPVKSVAAGEVEIAIAPLTTVLATPGIVPAAIFPEELGTHIDMSVFLSTSARQGADRVIAFLTASELDEELAEAGISRFELN